MPGSALPDPADVHLHQCFAKDLCWCQFLQATDTLCILWRAVDGRWHLPAKSKRIPDPMNGEPFIKVPDTQACPTVECC